MNVPRIKKIYKFEDFRLDAVHLLLYKNEREISLAPKVVETLLALVERCGEVLSKDELMNIVWTDSIVEEGNLSQNLYLLRKTLGERADGAPFIETLRRRGYRFTAAIKRVESASAKKFSSNKNQFAAREISARPHLFNGARRNDILSPNERNDAENGACRPQTIKPASAFEACQLARIYFQQITMPNLIKSRELLDEAVRLDADYAPAYVALAEQCVKEAIYGLSAPAESRAAAKNALRRASDLNLNSAEFYAATGFVNLVFDWNFAEAKRNLRKSLALNSHCAFANNYMGQVFMFQRQFDKAETYLRRSAEIEPTGLYNRGMVMVAYFLAREYQKSVEVSESILALCPQSTSAAQIRCWSLEQTGRAAEAVAEYEKFLNKPHGEFTKRWLGYAYALVGDEENARKIAAELVAESREHYVSPIHLAVIYAALNEPDKAFLHLENTFARRDPWMLWIAADPRLDNLRADSRFRKLEKSVASARTALSARAASRSTQM